MSDEIADLPDGAGAKSATTEDAPEGIIDAPEAIATAANTITITSALRKGAQALRQAGSDSAVLDVELLLADILQVNRAQLYGLNDRPLTEAEVQTFRAHLSRRGKMEPVAYILGRRAFYTGEFIVTPEVLIPRPETELLVETALQWIRDEKGLEPVRILEVGTGSGAIAISCLQQLEGSQVLATDISPAALKVAERNAQALLPVEAQARLKFVEMDGVLPLVGKETFDLIISNPPYIAAGELQNLPVQVRQFEPHAALLAGPTGLEVLTQLIANASTLLKKPGALIFECGDKQAGPLTLELQKVSSHYYFRRDLAGIERCGVLLQGDGS